MGWDYCVDKYYGYLVDARNTGKDIVDKIMQEYKCVQYEEHSNYLDTGEIIFYVYKQEIDSYHGCYAFGSPDTTGSTFESPRHPTYFKKYRNNPPDLTQDQKDALVKIEKDCEIKGELQWYEIAEVHY